MEREELCHGQPGAMLCRSDDAGVLRSYVKVMLKE